MQTSEAVNQRGMVLACSFSMVRFLES